MLMKTLDINEEGWVNLNELLTNPEPVPKDIKERLIILFDKEVKNSIPPEPPISTLKPTIISEGFNINFKKRGSE